MMASTSVQHSSSSTLVTLPVLSQLRCSDIKPSTFRAYTKAVTTFLTTTQLSHTDLLSMPIPTIDLYLSAFIESEYAASGSRVYAEQTMDGLHYYYPRLKSQLHESHHRLKGWKRVVPSVSHPPLPWNICVLASVTMAKQGHIHAAIATLLAHDCYLRISEFIALTGKDVRIPRDRRLGEPYQHTCIHMRQTKTRPNATVIISRPVIAQLLHRCVLSLHHLTDRIFPFNENVYRNVYLRDTLSALGLSHLHFRPHSLRHGGATHDYVYNHMSINEVVRRGRWANQKNASRYIQTLAAVDLTYLVPQQLDSDGHAFDSQLLMIMNHAIQQQLPPSPLAYHSS